MRAFALAFALALASAGATGCGGHHREKLPAACAGGRDAVLGALKAAPRAVRIDGVPISHCFTRGGSAEDEQIVGSALLPAAQALADRAAGDPEGPAALQLGYLIGASRRGASRGGVQRELVRRLQQEESTLPRRSGALRRGELAGLAKG